MEIKLTEEQQKAMDLLKSGQNVLLMGFAGTGKSTLLNQYRDYLDSKKINYLACAPTGIAAINIKGATLHSVFHAPTNYISEDEINKAKKPLETVREADVIFIDEISMCRSDLFDYVTTYIDQMCKGDEWCAGKQIVVCGDFSQLAPVIGYKDAPFFKEKSGFAFEGETWNKCNFRTVYLHHVIRQNDKEFINALNEARVGDQRCISYFNNLVSDYDDDGITLCATNKTVDELNHERLKTLPGETSHYYAVFSGDAKDRDFNGVEDLELKPGARVMSLVNDHPDDDEDHVRYANGTLGTVAACEDDCVKVDWDTGYTCRMGTYTWIKYEYQIDEETVEEEYPDPKTGEVSKKEKKKKKLTTKDCGKIVQIPLKLSYAITIHKSQGQTFDIVNADINETFGAGQAYVALSRCTNPDGLHLRANILPQRLKVAKDVSDFYLKCEEKELKIRKKELASKEMDQTLGEDIDESNILIVKKETAERIRKDALDASMTVSDYIQMLSEKGEKAESVTA